MPLFELLITLLLGGAVLTALANRVGAPYPVVLALAGTALAIAPIDVQGIRLDPDLALTLFVAPVILDAAFDASPRDLRENWIPVSSLVLVAVALTIAAVAIMARWLVPDMPWSVAIALGAVVSPPDPVSATAILGRLSPPRRLVVILEGEGLLNDVSALLVYRLAVTAALGTTLTVSHAVPLFLANSLGSVLLGWVLARVYLFMTARITDLSIAVVTQFVATFAVWIIAEKLGVSTVLTIVVYALVLARLTPTRQNAETRRGSFAVWEVAVYVLNALAFILVGLQLQDIGDSIPGGVMRYAAFGLAILGTVIAVRLCWTFTYNVIARLVERVTLSEESRTPAPRSYKSALVVGWCGMRGLLTLATALALPFDGAFARADHRDLVIVAAFAVVLGTLVIQGLTLGPLLRWLDLGDDGRGDRERAFARQEATRAALQSLDGNSEPEAAILRKEYAVVLQDETMRHLRPKVFGKLRMAAIRAERETLIRLRNDRDIGDDAYRDVEEELDWAEGNARRRGRALRPPEPTDETR
ncbi:MAG: cation:proton antiporter [Janthinobacterium lividum]